MSYPYNYYNYNNYYNNNNYSTPPIDNNQNRNDYASQYTYWFNNHYLNNPSQNSPATDQSQIYNPNALTSSHYAGYPQAYYNYYGYPQGTSTTQYPNAYQQYPTTSSVAPQASLTPTLSVTREPSDLPQSEQPPAYSAHSLSSTTTTSTSSTSTSARTQTASSPFQFVTNSLATVAATAVAGFTSALKPISSAISGASSSTSSTTSAPSTTSASTSPTSATRFASPRRQTASTTNLNTTTTTAVVRQSNTTPLLPSTTNSDPVEPPSPPYSTAPSSPLPEHREERSHPHELVAHHFVELSSQITTVCGFCKKSVNGPQLLKAEKCNNCGFVAHELCIPNISTFCSFEAIEAEKLRKELEEARRRIEQLQIQTQPVSASSMSSSALPVSPSTAPVAAASVEKAGNDNERDDECIVCMENKINTVLLECGHRALCHVCASELQICPVCRQSITRVIKIYNVY